jgi:hypothetical protein
MKRPQPIPPFTLEQEKILLKAYRFIRKRAAWLRATEQINKEEEQSKPDCLTTQTTQEDKA